MKLACVVAVCKKCLSPCTSFQFEIPVNANKRSCPRSRKVGTIPSKLSFTSSLDLVEHMVSCLWRLPIRRPAPLDRMKESASDTTPYQPLDIMHVREKFRLIEERLTTRLSRIISRRRQHLRYRTSHTDAIRGSQLTGRRRIFAARFGSIEESYEATPSMTASTRYTHDTMATTLKLDQQNYVIPDVNDFFAPSIASSSSSTFSANSNGDSSIKIPNRPKGVGKTSSEQFICPYCQTTQTVSTDRKWRLVLPDSVDCFGH